jgi:hypothetical protein
MRHFNKSWNQIEQLVFDELDDLVHRSRASSFLIKHKGTFTSPSTIEFKRVIGSETNEKVVSLSWVSGDVTLSADIFRHCVSRCTVSGDGYRPINDKKFTKLMYDLFS